MRTASVAALFTVSCALACAKHPQQGGRIVTTDGALAVSNLSAQIAGQEVLLKRRPASIETVGALIELLEARAQFTGSVNDYRRVAELGQSAVATAPQDPAARIARASSFAALHKFPEALADLDGVDDPAAKSLRASILQAQGHTAEALELRRAAVREYANTKALGALAAVEPDLPAALLRFADAEKAYRDTSPFPLAWLDFQRGLLFEKRGRFDEARAAYAAAVERLPQYAQAQAHLAGMTAVLGDRVRAVAILRPLATLDDPEYAGLLAGLEPDPAEAARLRNDAARRYEALLLQFPQAFADHAARFYLDRQPARALALARLNLGVRKTREAYDLALSAAIAANESDCALAKQAAALPDGGRRMQTLAERACPSIAAGGAGGGRRRDVSPKAPTAAVSAAPAR